MDCKIEYKLKQETPMIHFQWDEVGVCLRASEVKPKLDRFIIECLGGKEKIKKDIYENGLESEFYNFFVEAPKKNEKGKYEVNKWALNYKMKIIAEGNPIISTSIEDKHKKDSEDEIYKKYSNGEKLTNNIKNKIKEQHSEKFKKIEEKYNEQIQKKNASKSVKINDMYFGNMSAKENWEADFKETIYYDTPLSIEVICFCASLRRALVDNIALFFAMNNFGTRQSKGFGSFSIDDNDKTNAAISHMKKKYYFIDYNQDKSNYDNKLSDIALIYGFMKSGYNYTKFGSKNDYVKGFIFKYFLEKNIASDKKFAKEKVLKLKEGEENGLEYGYVRGLLGVSEGVNFRTYNNPNKNTKNVNLDGIERFQSPVTFKVIRDYVFIIPKEIPSEIKGASFYILSNSDAKKISVENKDKYKDYLIEIPKDFCMDDFIESFVNAFNDKDNYVWGKTKDKKDIVIGTEEMRDRQRKVVLSDKFKRAKKIQIKIEDEK